MHTCLVKSATGYTVQLHLLHSSSLLDSGYHIGEVVTSVTYERREQQQYLGTGVSTESCLDVRERVNFERIKTGVGTAFEYFLIRLIGLLDVEIKITSEKTQSSQSS